MLELGDKRRLRRADLGEPCRELVRRDLVERVVDVVLRLGRDDKNTNGTLKAADHVGLAINA